MQDSVGIVIPTFQAAKHLQYCLPPLLQSSLKPKILVIDSSSTDGTADLAKSLGAEVLTIPQATFNHGTTRELGRQHLQTSIVIMLTQDAYLTSSVALEKLIEPLCKREASIAYARQIPHVGAGPFATFARHFNYPAQSQQRSLAEAKAYGVYTFFCSNSCAAYLNAALDEIGGFPAVLFGEDTIVVAKLLHRQHRIAYVAEAEVHHSHDYTLKQEFCRHFDMGLARHIYQDLIQVAGTDTQRGKTYVKHLLSHLRHHYPTLIPYAFLQTAAKLCGYQLGKKSIKAPLWFKKFFSSQKNYWKK